ncbi:MAG: phosphatase PAP2 family protein [Treponema sp.]|jgi:membrane-associated phospholipid phosphatase|nr:phosphatase PAP2 family protein [Treponema sp.]
MQIRKGAALLCLFFSGFAVFAESAYRYDLVKDSVIGSLSLGIFAGSFVIPNNPPAPGASLERGTVNGFDRPFMAPYSKGLDITGDVLTCGFLLAPVLPVLANIRDRDALLTYGIMYSEAFFLTFGTTDLIKSLVDRDRPYRYFGPLPPGQEEDFLNSFPSRHTALAFMSAGFLAGAFLAEFPGSPWTFPVISAGYTLAAGISAARILSGSHFLSDVLAGAVIGSLYGYLIPCLHRKPKNEGQAELSLTPLIGGIAVSLRW